MKYVRTIVALIVLGIMAIPNVATAGGTCVAAVPSNGCSQNATNKFCGRDFNFTGATPSCMSTVVNAPATGKRVSAVGPVSNRFLVVRCRAPLGETMGSCSFNCGSCGAFVADMVNGLPVELLEFEVTAKQTYSKTDEAVTEK